MPDLSRQRIRGIPGCLVNYLYAEKLTYRKRALQTQEVADLATTP